MPKFEVTAPNKKRYEVDAPDEQTAYDWGVRYAKEEDELKAQRPGFFGSLKDSFKDATLGGIKAVHMALDPNNAELEKEVVGNNRPQHKSEDFTEPFKAGNYWEAAKELGGFAASGLGSSIGAMAPAAVAGIGTTALTGNPVLGGAAAYGMLTAGHNAENVEQQAQNRAGQRAAGEQVSDWDFPAAGLAALPQAAIDMVELRASKLLGFMGLEGKAVSKEVQSKILQDATEQLAKEGKLLSFGIGTARTAAVEVPGEVGQNILGNMQAGVPLTDDAAMAGYKEAMWGAGVISPAFGTVGRRMEVGRAREDISTQAALAQQQDAQQQAATQQAATQQAPAAPTAPTTPPPGLETIEQSRIDHAVNTAQARQAAGDTTATPLSVVDEERAASNTRLASVQTALDTAVANQDVAKAAALQKQVTAEKTNLNSWGGISPDQEVALQKSLDETKKKYDKSIKSMLSETDDVKVDAHEKEATQHKAAAAAIQAQLAQINKIKPLTLAPAPPAAPVIPATPAQSVTTPATPPVQKPATPPIGTRATQAIPVPINPTLTDADIDALGVAKNASQIRKTLKSLSTTVPEERQLIRETIQAAARNKAAKTSFISGLDELDRQYTAQKDNQATANALENEIPVAEVPVAEVPVAEVPVAEVPVAEVPVAEVSVVKPYVIDYKTLPRDLKIEVETDKGVEKVNAYTELQDISLKIRNYERLRRCLG